MQGNPIAMKKGTIRAVIRNGLVALSVAITAPLWLLAKLSVFVGKEGPFVSCGQLISMIPGTAGVMLRRGYYIMTLHHMAWDCGIGFGTWFSHAPVRIERGVSIGANCTIGICDIGRNTLVGSNVDILSGRKQHNYLDLVRDTLHEGEFTRVIIGQASWIGNSSVIMSDIGKRCVIGAGSVVVSPINEYSVAAGNPARTIRKLKLN